ncbi:MAG: cytochrome c [Oligoflexia bacterium]|nr:cytochrome c [Oligoflexia bacterium]
MSESKGIGPVKELKLAAVDAALAEKGQAVFQAKCSACHKLQERFVGPPLKNVTLRRQPEWIMNMILNPSEMLQKDAVARKLLEEYLTQMANMSLTQEEARQVLEYFRRTDGAK